VEIINSLKIAALRAMDAAMLWIQVSGAACVETLFSDTLLSYLLLS
jgi:hypothetical protein